MKLTEEQIELIQERVTSSGIKHSGLSDDIVDHICCVIENQSTRKEVSFEIALQRAIKDLSPNGLQTLEHKTHYLLNHKRIKTMKITTYIIGFISTSTLTLGILFYLMSWPGAYPLFSIGFLSFCLLFIPYLTFKNYRLTVGKSKSVKTKLIIGVTASILAGLSGVFKIYHLQGANVLLVLGALVFAFGYLPFQFFMMYKEDKVA